jgi:hypothetical protein
MGKWPIGKENEQRAESLKKTLFFLPYCCKKFFQNILCAL